MARQSVTGHGRRLGLSGLFLLGLQGGCVTPPIRVQTADPTAQRVTRDITPLTGVVPGAVRDAVIRELSRRDVADAWFYELESVTECPGNAGLYLIRARRHALGGPPDSAGKGRAAGGVMPVLGTFDRFSHEMQLMAASEGRLPPACPTASNAVATPSAR